QDMSDRRKEEATGTKSVSDVRLGVQMRNFVADTVQNRDLTHGVTAEGIESAYPEINGFGDVLADILPEPDAKGLYSPAAVAAIRLAMDYGSRLTSEQLATIFSKVQEVWDRRRRQEQPRSDQRKPVVNDTLQRTLLDQVTAVAGSDDFIEGGTALEVFGDQADEFARHYAQVLPDHPQGALLSQAEIAAGRCLLHFGDRLTLEQKQEIVSNAQPTLDRYRAKRTR